MTCPNCNGFGQEHKPGTWWSCLHCSGTGHVPDLPEVQPDLPDIAELRDTAAASVTREQWEAAQLDVCRQLLARAAWRSEHVVGILLGMSIIGDDVIGVLYSNGVDRAELAKQLENLARTLTGREFLP